MLYGQNVYCNNSFLQEIIKERKKEPYKTLYNILKRLSDIFLDISQEDLMALVKSDDNPLYTALFNREHLGLHSMLEWRARIDFADLADEVFFIEPGYIDNKKIGEEQGWLVLSSDKVDDITKLNKLKVFYLVPKSERIGIEEDTYESWEEVFSKQKMKPLNALIISDNYMFGDHFEERKEHSLFALLKSLVPPSLTIDFHLSIFFCNEDGMFAKEKAEKVIQEIKDLKLVADPSKLKVSIIAHTKKSLTHDRHIISNYFFTYSGSGFSVIDKDGIQQIAKGECKSVFNSISNLVGNASIKHEYNLMQCWLKKIYDRQAGTGPTSYIVGDDFVHRLLK